MQRIRLKNGMDPISHAEHPSLIGRDGQLAVVHDAFDRLEDRGQTIRIMGEPGVGKSALLNEAVMQARRRGMCVLMADGVESENHLPFSTLHRLLRPVLDHIDVLPSGHRDALLGAFGITTSEIAPEPFFIALAALELIADVSSQTPVVAVIDDLQWVDAASRDVIEFVGRRLDDERAILLLATRPEQRTRPLERSATTVTLERLDRSESRELLRTHVCDLSATMEHRVLELAAGNPLALLELPISLGASEPDRSRSATMSVPLTARLEQAFADRADELEPATRALVLVAALHGGDHASEVLAAASDLTGEETSTTTFEPAIGAGLLTLDGATFRFRHPLVRSAIIENASWSDRVAAHEALARTLSTDADRATWHRSLAADQPDAEVAQALDDAADRALARGAAVLAASFLERAARLSPDPQLRGRRLTRAAWLSFELGDAAGVKQLSADARELPLDDVDHARLAGLDGAFDDGVPGDDDAVRRLVAAAHRASATDEGLAGMLLVGASMPIFWGASPEPVRAVVRQEAHRLALPPSHPCRLLVDAVLDPFTRGAAIVADLSTWAEQETPDAGLASMLGKTGFVVGDFARALLFAHRASNELRKEGRIALLAQTLVLESFAALYLGQWDVMQVTSAEAVRFGEETNQPTWTACARLGLANLDALRGDRLLAQQAASEVEAAALVAGNRSLLNGIQLTRGLAALGDEAPADAFTALRPMMNPDDSAWHMPQSVWAIDLLADAAVLAGRIPEARTIVSEFDHLVEHTTAPGVRRAMALAHALLADDDPEERFASALELASAASPWYRARLDLAIGTWLRRHRRVIESRGPLRAAHTVFDTLGATAWSKRAERELVASGERRERREPDGWARLSAQELQIAELAAEGLSNREIGSRLYLSHRTVGSHLYRVFPKLGVTSRAQLHLALVAR